MNIQEHPIAHLQQYFQNKYDVVLQFSIYEYEPQTILDSRKIIDLPLADFNVDWFEKIIGQLNIGEELAVHSIYRNKSGTKYHIPMIDLDCDISELEVAKNRLSKVLPPKIFAGLQFYDSGRSLHAYGSMQLDNQKWIDFMGRLLLANLPEKSPVVDSRWIGHRLMGGFSSLRLSSNSGQYVKVPIAVK